MADSGEFRTVEMFWSTVDDGLCKKKKQSLPKKKSHSVGKKTCEVQTKVSGKSCKPTKELPGPEVQQPAVQKEGKKASLKDLCLEDKTRVASLIKELSRLGEEKETVTDLLNKERELFEERIKEILAQQEKIINERLEIEKQLHECQKLIVKYQEVIKRKEATLVLSNTSSDRRTSEKENLKPGKKNATKFKTEPSQFSKSLKVPETSNYNDSKRPFTSAIDKLIQEEKNKSVNSNVTEDDREMKLGPLLNPHFESTQISDVDAKSDNAPEFNPLDSEYTSTCPSVNITASVNNSRPSSSEASKTEDCSQYPLSDTQDTDIEAQRQKKNEEMKQQLKLQKQALMMEQERLKIILAEQEALLVSKQHQLWKQQDIQRNRLEHFEKTGHFPAPESTIGNTVPLPYQPPVFSNTGLNPRGSVPVPTPQFSPMVQQSALQNQTFSVPHNMNGMTIPMATTSPDMNVLNVPPYNNMYVPNLQPLSNSQHSSVISGANPIAGTVQNGFQNARNNDYVDALNDEIQLLNSVKIPANYHHNNNMPSFQSRKAVNMAHGPNKHMASCNGYDQRRVVRDDKMGKLLDIVDEVDSLYDQSSDMDMLKPYLMPTRRLNENGLDDSFQGRMTSTNNSFSSNGSSKMQSSVKGNFQLHSESGNADFEECDDDLDESQVLEDVFFIK